MKRAGVIISIVLVFLVLIIVALVYAIPRIWDQKIAGNSVFTFYGKVDDTAGNPVAGVTVRYHVTSHEVFGPQPLNPFVRNPTAMAEGQAITDSNGNFRFQCDGYNVDVWAIEMAGFDPAGSLYPNGSNPDYTFTDTNSLQSTPFVPSDRVTYTIHSKSH